MPPQFISEQIRVATDGEIKQPVSFVWKGTEYQVTEILLSWFDWGFPPGASQRDWRTRRHRNYYRVRTNTGELFELYLDRATPSGNSEWFLYQRLDPEKS
ncbi:MAG: hypothetical protein HZB43_12180 [candidate division Zixibacteria bacterium]|nr:hypothetical protein [candidate division Zixibacteria bacterium]